MNCERTVEVIVKWLKKQLSDSGLKGFVVGVSGGIDSAVVSELCVRTSEETRCLIMPIHQNVDQTRRAMNHCRSLADMWGSVHYSVLNLTNVFEEHMALLNTHFSCSNLVAANLRSRLRMCTLYAFANDFRHLVVGTGNKVEDFGVGFFTKYGDGGVDISPIGRLTKTQVYELAESMGVSKEILEAVPSDGLWSDNRSDEDQLGDSYENLEEAMKICEDYGAYDMASYQRKSVKFPVIFSNIPWKTMENYITKHAASAHKMSMPPIGPEPVL